MGTKATKDPIRRQAADNPNDIFFRQFDALRRNLAKDILLFLRSDAARNRPPRSFVPDPQRARRKSTEIRMRNIVKFGTAAAFALAAFGAGSTASAAIVCNRDGACWHVKRAYSYPAEAGVVIHPNGWRWGPREHFTWRERTGRGYWRNGVWVTF
jgi:hypothetical protein